MTDTISGQITYRRAISKKLVFYDVLCTSSPEDGPGSSECIEVIVKEGVYGSIQEVKDLRDQLKLGDSVAVQGRCENDHTMQAVHVSVVQAWKEQNPNTAFKPQPSNLKQHPPAHKQQGQQQDQQQVALTEQQPAVPAGVSQEEAAHGSSSLLAHATAEQAGGSSATAAAAAATAGAAASKGPGSGVSAALQEPQIAVCKFFVNTGRCAKGSACPYTHLITCRGGWLKQRQSQRAVLSSSLGYSHSESAAAKGRRAQVFAAWLVETFGKEALNAGAGVLDVAGGAGGMTYELCVVHDVKATLVDPRPLKLNRQQHKQLSQAGRTAVLVTWTAEQLQQGCLVAEQRPLQQQRQQVLVQQVGPEKQQLGQQAVAGMNQHVEQHKMLLPLQQQQEVAGQGDPPTQQRVAADLGQQLEDQHQHHQQQQVAGQPGGVVQFQQVQGWFGTELWRSSAWQQLFGSASLVIGLHPDQATEPIVDYALEAGLPFAVMPCCVFPRLFPDRQLVRGDELLPVTSYAELVEYLTAKGQAQQQVLNFVGANIVVYRWQRCRNG